MNKNFTTILAAIVLVLVGIYVVNQRNNNRNELSPTYTETVVDESGEEVELTLDHPLTESFSNAVSNSASKDSAVNNTPFKTTSYPAINYVAETLVKPFVLGFYYFDTINKKGVEKCTPKSTKELKELEDFPEYNKDNFVLESILIQDKKVYMYVDADEVPEAICAQVLLLNNIKSKIFDAIHVIVQ